MANQETIEKDAKTHKQKFYKTLSSLKFRIKKTATTPVVKIPYSVKAARRSKSAWKIIEQTAQA